MDFSGMSLGELREEAKIAGIKGFSSMKKQELADALKALERVEDARILEEHAEAKKKALEERKKEAKPAEKSAQKSVKPVAKTAAKPAPEGARTAAKPAPEGARTAAKPAPEGARTAAKPAPEAVKTAVKSAPEGAKTAAKPTTEAAKPAARPAAKTVRLGNAETGADRTQSRPEERIAEKTSDSRSSDKTADRPAREQQPDQSRKSSGREFFDNNRLQAQNINANATEGKIIASAKITSEEREALDPTLSPEIEQLDSGETKMGILEVMPEQAFGFIRCNNYLPGEHDVYVSPTQIRKFNLKTGDIITGNTKVKAANEKFSALLYIKTINGMHPNEAVKRKRFEDLTPIFPHDRIRLETRGCLPALRIVDLLSPIGKGQRGMIVSQPKAGKTTLLKQIAKAIQTNYPSIHVIILLIDERPEEVTDMKEYIQGPNVEVIYSTFDELPENHKRVSEMAVERAKRLVEHGKDVVILLDSITRLARAYNLTCQPSGRTLSGGLDPAALHMPKRFFGAARCMREGGSLTVLATALVETGSRMDDVVFEEFKGTGNMELVLDRNLSERRIFPAIDLPRSSTRREDLLLNKDEIEANNILRRAFNSSKTEEVIEKIISMFSRTRNNAEFIDMLKNTRLY